MRRMGNFLRASVSFLRTTAFSLLLVLIFCSHAASEGHYLPGVVPIRDFEAIPEGWYYEQYNVFYSTDRFKDRNGNSVNSIGTGAASVDLDFDVDVFAIAPTFIYMSDWEVLDAKLGFTLSPSFGNTSVGASISIGERGREIDDSSFGLGDLYVQPLWMLWDLEQIDLSLVYGFYAPIGDFDIEDNDNVGLGYWSNQFQGAAVYHLDETKATAFSVIGTFEINGEQEDSDFQPGNNISLEWGVSQFLSEHFEVGLAGYHYWQVSDDKGVTAPPRLRPDRERVHGLGLQTSYYPSERGGIILRFLTEVEARSRFEGNLLSLTAFYVF